MTTSARKKYKCPDCKQCQGCSEARCNLCRGQAGSATSQFAGLSMAEQIALYEAVNKGEAPEGDYKHVCICGKQLRTIHP